jgi:NhaP-type Na+/H+ or K+/H+ antiporter
MSPAEWSLFVGALLVTMVLAGTLLGRLPLSSAMIYLVLGWALGPDVMNVLRPDPVLHAGALEHVAEVGLLISLFAVGMQLGVPLRDRRWRLPMRLAFVSMAVMVALVAAIGFWALHLSSDRPRARNRRAIGARPQARPAGFQPGRRRRAQRRGRISIRDAGTRATRHS